MNRNLVTGGAGFLGSHLIDQLISQGEDVICLDNFHTGSKKNITHLMNNPKFELIRHDITEPISLEVDRIWHLACPASPIHYQSNPIKTAKTNFLGTYNMLGLSKRNNARILFTSTSEVYGDPEVHPQAETYKGNVNNIGIRSCYDEGKRIAETLCFDYKREHNLDIRVIRIFNTYGPRMQPQDGRVISNFIMQGLNDQPLTIYGEGNQTRSFCYVSDLINGITKCMNGNYSGPINLGNPEEYTILEVANMIKKELSIDKEFIFKDLPQDDPSKRRPIIKIASEKIGWQPKVSLQEGLKPTIEYFKKFIH